MKYPTTVMINKRLMAAQTIKTFCLFLKTNTPLVMDETAGKKNSAI